MDDAGLDLPEFADQVNGEFGLGFCTLDGLMLLEIVLAPGLDPLREALSSQATAAFSQLIEDDVVRKSIVEHEINHVASCFWEAGDFIAERRAGCGWGWAIRVECGIHRTCCRLKVAGC